MTTIATIIGTRPEILRLSVIIKKLDKYCNQILVHTGQNYDPKLSDIFFEELGIRKPDHYLGIKENSFGGQIGQILAKSQELFEKEKPDKILILGDTNSGLASIVAKRMGIPVYHMEAGNRCYSNEVPEETNRVIIDHCSTIHMPYTQRAKENLLREGIPLKDIYVIGNPIYEVIKAHEEEINKSRIIDQLKLSRYFLATFHRAENVNNEKRLANIISALKELHGKNNWPVVCSVHPHTRNKIEQFGLDTTGLRMCEPFGFADFTRLEKEAECIISDSGTVSEDATILRKPCVTIRNVTERPETIECGANIISGLEVESIVRCAKIAMSEQCSWIPPEGYLDENVSEKVVKVVLGWHSG